MAEMDIQGVLDHLPQRYPLLMVDRVLDMLASGPARLSEECQEDQTPAIEARQERGEGADEEGDRA